MTLADAAPGRKPSALVARAVAILTRPAEEWQVIDGEPATIGSLYASYIAILAAIPPLCRFLGGQVFGYGFLGVSYRPSFLSALATALVSYALSLLGVFIVAWIVAALAPSFGGAKNRVQAVKLVGYSATATWAAGVFALLPLLGFLSLLGLYSFYLFYKGLPVLMKSPVERRAGYTAVVVIAALLVSLLITPLTVGLVGSTVGLVGSGGTVKLPDGGVVQFDRLQQVTKSVEEAARRAQSSSNPAGVPIDTLKQMLPATLAGAPRQDVSSAGGQIAGFGGSNVTARYATNGRTITLSVTDLGAAGALSAIAGALGMKATQESGSSSSRMDQVDGRTIIETYDAQARSGDSALILANRFMVKAQGSGVSLDELRAAVNAVDLPKLEAMAR